MLSFVFFPDGVSALSATSVSVHYFHRCCKYM